MQSNNPVLTRVETYSDFNRPMTIRGAIQKSVMLTVVSAVVGITLFFYCAMTANANWPIQQPWSVCSGADSGIGDNI